MKRLIAAATLLCAACSSKDTTPPPPPQIDAPPATTALASITVTGTAEYGSKVTVQRTARRSAAARRCPTR
jgi:hypothetical protein